MANCKECGRLIEGNEFCNDVCAGRYHGKKSLLIDYGIGNCKRCDNEFKKRAKNQVYCSDKCRLKSVYNNIKDNKKYNCKVCGKDTTNLKQNICIECDKHKAF